MNLTEGKEKFIQTWGTLGSNWGINRTMAQIHALLLISPNALSAEEIMEELKISRGNTNMNVRALMDWGLVFKELKAGERREFFYAEKDMWKVAMQVVKERRKRELEPIIGTLQELKKIQDDSAQGEQFSKTIEGLDRVIVKADKTIDLLIKADENWFMNNFLKVLMK
ncbi:MAG: transcriptional regulator [Bacteroidota bacterium]|nr:transcriptional regulator [Bacteroidota bacterium]MDX5430602.1 transcriptional regulator [Bacteroidota bacterium]MDX5469354.1 transcriptional regulator [Bacteroidota bacterium]